jgi:hypothetical protein
MSRHPPALAPERNRRFFRWTGGSTAGAFGMKTTARIALALVALTTVSACVVRDDGGYAGGDRSGGYHGDNDRGGGDRDRGDRDGGDHGGDRGGSDHYR